MFCVKSEDCYDKFYRQKENAIAETERVLKESLGRYGDAPEAYGYKYDSWRELAEVGGLFNDLVWWFEIEFEDEKPKKDLEIFTDMLDKAEDIDYTTEKISKNDYTIIGVGDTYFHFDETGHLFVATD